MSLTRRFLLGFGSVLGLVLLFYGYVLYAFEALHERAGAQARIAATVETAHGMAIETLDIMQRLDEFADAREPGVLRDLYAKRAAAAATRARLRQSTDRSAVVALLDRYEALLPARLEAAERIIDAVDTGASDAQIRALKQARNLLDRRALEFPRQIVDIEQEALNDALAETAALRAEILRNTTVLATAIGFLTIMLALRAARGIAQRLAPLARMAESLARGDLAARVEVSGRDEVAMLAVSFNRMAAELEQLDRSKDEFVGLASHQLLTPVTAVKGNLSMLLDDYFGEVPAEQRQILQNAYAANERQIRLIDELLNVARIQTGRLAITRAPVDVAAIVREVLAEHRFAAESRSQRLDVILPETLTITADAHKLKIVIDNLVSNAVKYTPRGGHIEVAAADTGRRVTLTVEDNGVGIPAAARERLFRKFSRIDNPLSAESGGTGLGLYLANEIVKLHGGTIDVEGAAGVGSTFHVHLPKA